jgi:N-methylhydantoinase B
MSSPQTSNMIDPFELEVIGDALIAIGDEMFVTTQRTSQSTIIYEVLDFAVGLTDEQGSLITQGNGVTFFLATLDAAVRSVLEKFAPSEIREGDIFVTNDPYGGGGTHLSDVALAMPIFYRGELVSWAVNKAHWTEVGGKDPGSVSTETIEIFQEGLRLPTIRLFSEGTVDVGLLDLIRVNVRLPEMSIGDLFAQAASVRLAGQRFGELCDRHGVELVKASITRMNEHAAQLVRLQMETLPQGVFEAEDWLDPDANGGPYRIAVKVTIDGEKFVCDFTGSHEQLRNSMNCTGVGLNSGVRAIFKALTIPEGPVNEGLFRPLEIICPAGTVFSATPPAAVSTYWESMCYAADLVWKAVAAAIPERATAGHFLSASAEIIAGEHPTSGELTILFEPNPGGWGGGPGKDGERGLVCIGDGETYNIPIEVAEQRYGVFFEEYGLDVTGAGAGQWRGGEGVVRSFRITAPTAVATGIFGRHTFKPWGVEGGREGSANGITFVRTEDGDETTAGMVTGHGLQQGDLVRVFTGTGGGWGNPLDRDPELVARDVRDEFVSFADARDVYGVVVDETTFAVTGLTEARA